MLVFVENIQWAFKGFENGWEKRENMFGLLCRVGLG